MATAIKPVKTTALEEMQLIADRHGGVLNPPDVVAFAANPRTALHSRFDWDDAIAGPKYRLWQARQLISVSVKVLPGVKTPVKMWVSMKADRYGGGGYRSVSAVMADPEAQEQLLAEAYADMIVFRKKYNLLKRLAPIIAAMGSVLD